jgi:hypothetical protein
MVFGMETNQDSEGYSTKVTFLGKGWGIRVLCHARVVVQDFVTSKRYIGPAIASMLRMIDKCGNPSSMASASRDRNYCGRPDKLGPTYEELLRRERRTDL